MRCTLLRGKTDFKRCKDGISTVIGTIIVLGVILIAVISIISLQVTYQQMVIQRNQFDQDRKSENFAIDDSLVNGTKIRVTNLGTIQIQIVAVYVSHTCRWSVSPQSGCSSSSTLTINSQTSQWVSTGTGGLVPNDLVTVTTARGNEAVAIFPVINTLQFGVGNNLYFGTGPLSITFANWSFTYSFWNQGTIKNQTQGAWSGIPSNKNYINPLFKIAIINHAQGNITLLQQSVLYWDCASCTSNSRSFFMIVDSSSWVNGNANSGLIAYNAASGPYVIPQNATDPATGGAPVMVSFAATAAGTSTQQQLTSPSQLPSVLLVFLGLVFTWNGHQYSENIPFANLRIYSG